MDMHIPPKINLDIFFVPRLNEVEEGGYLNYPSSVRGLFMARLALSSSARVCGYQTLPKHYHLWDGGHLELRVRIFSSKFSEQQVVTRGESGLRTSVTSGLDEIWGIVIQWMNEEATLTATLTKYRLRSITALWVSQINILNHKASKFYTV